MKRFLVERTTREHCEVEVWKEEADEKGGWETAAIEKAVEDDDWEVDEVETRADNVTDT